MGAASTPGATPTPTAPSASSATMASAPKATVAAGAASGGLAGRPRAARAAAEEWAGTRAPAAHSGSRVAAPDERRRAPDARAGAIVQDEPFFGCKWFILN